MLIFTTVQFAFACARSDGITSRFEGKRMPREPITSIIRVNHNNIRIIVPYEEKTEDTRHRRDVT